MDRLDFYFWTNSRKFAPEKFNFIVARNRVCQLNFSFINQTVLADFTFIENGKEDGAMVHVLYPAQEAKLSAYLTARYAS